jgi:hypothetical protein
MRDLNDFDFVGELEKLVLRDNPAAGRLARALEELGLLSIDPARLWLVLDEWFGQEAITYGEALSLQGPPLAWDLLHLGGEDSQLTYLAPSRERALAGLLQAVESPRLRLYPKHVKLTAHEVRLSNASDEVVAVIAPATFAEHELPSRRRVEELLKGIRARGELERLAKRLARFPGLSSTRAQLRSETAPGGSLLSYTPNNMTSFLRRMLQGVFSIDIKQHVAQELLARMLGVNSWHQIVAHRDLAWGFVRPMALFTYESRKEDIELHRCPADAVVAFARACRAREGAPQVEVCVDEQLGGNTLILQAYESGPRSDAGVSRPTPLLFACGRLPEVAAGGKYLESARHCLSCDTETGERRLRSYLSATRRSMTSE